MSTEIDLKVTRNEIMEYTYTWNGSQVPIPELVYDVMGNKAITLPKQWPLARPQLATRQARLERSELRLGFAWALQGEQHTQGLPVLPPCSWCGHPTGGYCDVCTTTVANPVCSACGGTTFDIIATCCRCIAIKKMCTKKGTATEHAQ